MAKLTLGEREFVLPPYMFREFKQAAPYIDLVLSARQSVPGPDDTLDNVMAKTTTMMENAFAVIAVGIRRARLDGAPGDKPDLTLPMEEQIAKIVDELVGLASMADASNITLVFNSILEEGGLRKANPNPTKEAEIPETPPSPSPNELPASLPN